MILKAFKNITLQKNCFMIGDEKKDFLAAKKSGVLFEYKKKISLEYQVKKIINKINYV